MLQLALEVGVGVQAIANQVGVLESYDFKMAAPMELQPGTGALKKRMN